MMDDISVDTHLCIRCIETIVGIEAYLDHRRDDCLSTTVAAATSDSSTVAAAAAAGRVTAATASTNAAPSATSAAAAASNALSACDALVAAGSSGPADARNTLDIPFLPDVPELPDFFLSLDLQRITPRVVEEGVVDNGAAAADDDDDDMDEDYDPLRPPHEHTGGKWRPGGRPSIMQGLDSYRDALRDSSPERLPDMLEKMGCAPCGRIFRDKYTYQRHLESALHRKRSLRNAKILREHCSAFEVKSPEVPLESPPRSVRASRTKRPVQLPLEDVPREKKLKKQHCRCSLCYKWFSDTRKLGIHMMEHRTSTGFGCSQCAQKCSDEKELRLHLKTHKAYQTCCGIVFTTSRGYREHKEREHAAIREWLSCSDCQRQYRTSRALREHVCKNSEKKLSCPLCDYMGSRRNLILHRRTHDNDRRYKCSKCDYCATRHGQLWRHMKLHEGDKPHQCPYCDFSCALIENLRAHILKGSKHKGLKVYPCDKCAFATNNSIEAKQHADSHQFL